MLQLVDLYLASFGNLGNAAAGGASNNKRDVSVSGNGFASSTENGVTQTAGDPAVAAQVAAQIQAAFGNIPG